MDPHEDDAVRLLTRAQVKDYLQIGDSKLDDLLASGEIVSIKFGAARGSARRIPITALRDFIARQMEAAK